MAWCIARMGARCLRAKARWKIPRCAKKKSFTIRKRCGSPKAPLAKVKEGQVLFSIPALQRPRSRARCKTFQNLTIITNAVNIAAELAGTAVEVILTGGTLRKNSFSLVGPIAEETLRRLSADILFLGVDGFDVQFGLSTPNLLEAKVNRVMVEVAKKTVAVCDASKFGRRSLSLIAPPHRCRKSLPTVEPQNQTCEY